MPFDTGDVIIFDKGFGHVAMGYSNEFMIHANMTNNFHKIPWITEEEDKKGNPQVVEAVRDGMIYTPPWAKCADAAARKLALRTIADELMTHATYGAYRAVRLFMGSSIYGPDANERFQKYRDRQLRGFQDEAGQPKFVTTITCAEAVILCFQLACADLGEPFFLRLDGAHTMPSTLGKYLAKNWGEPRKG